MRNSLRRFTALVCSVAILHIGVVPAAAQDPHSGESAEQHYQTAVSLFGEGRYREALDEFDEAIAISPEPIFYCNRAVVLVKLREPVAAVESMQICRNTFEGSEAELAQIDAQTQAMETFVATVRLSSSEVARSIASGPVVVVEAPDQAERKGWTMADTGYVTLAFGLAAVGSALTLDLLSADIRDEFLAEAEGGPGTSRERYDELKADYDQRQTVFLILSGVGAGLVLLGTGLVVWDWTSDDTVSASVAPTDGGVAGSIRIRF